MGKDLRANKRIRVAQVRLVGHDGEQLGILPIRDALKAADEQGLDLVEVAPTARPPVCRIMDYGKYRYQLSKKSSSKHKTIELKEVKIRPQINKHDLDLKIRNIKKFIGKGNKAKVTMIFRGREIVHSALYKGVFEIVFNEVSEVAKIDQMARMEGRNMTMILSPKS